ncbi:PIN domain-like protein [Ceratobasidium sp. AG-I]|nr:PIN domain-like protein [Ceratobasidium sp. AG-I]
MGVLNIIPLLRKKCPQIIETLPSRLQALEGKTIAMDGTLITQRLHFTPDPRPHRHILGWYQLIAELRQHNIKVICVFDGKGRIAAKQNEVARRKRVRLQAKVRGEWEKSRHERLLELTRVLQELESMPDEDQREVLINLQLERESGSLPVLKEEEDIVADIPVVLLPSQPPAADTPTLTHLEHDLTATPTVLESKPPAAESSEPTTVDIPVDTTGDVSTVTELPKPAAAPGKTAAHAELSETMASDVGPPEADIRLVDEPKPVKKDAAEKAPPTVEVTVEPTSSDNQTTTPSESSGTPSPPSSTKRPHDPSSDGLALNLGSPSDPTATKDDPTSAAPTPDSALSSDTIAKPEIGGTDAGDHPTLITPDKAQAEPLDLSPGPEASKHLSSVILDLHNHYIKTSTTGSNGLISALTEESSSPDVPDIPISKVQLKFTQAESELWKEIVPTSSDTKVDIARVSELVQQFALVELPSEESVEQEEVAAEAANVIVEAAEQEDPMSERSAQLEEQSGRMVASLLRRSDPPTSLTYAESRLILEAMGVPCVQSYIPFEAEALASSLVLNGLADFVGSEDTDVLMYNAPLLRNLTDRKVPLQIIPPSTEVSLGLTRSAFVDTAILMGTDFVRKLEGIGPMTAIRLMHKHGSIERMLEEEPKFRPADVAEYIDEVKVARSIFSTLPPVPAAEYIAQGSWDEQAIQETMARFGLQRYAEEIIPNALADNYFNDDPSSDIKTP